MMRCWYVRSSYVAAAVVDFRLRGFWHMIARIFSLTQWYGKGIKIHCEFRALSIVSTS